MTTKLNASVFRDTRFEIRSVHQGPNSFVLEVGVRGSGTVVDGRFQGVNGPPLEAHESLFTDEEMTLVHQALELLENKYAEAYDKWANSPERAASVIAAAADAERRLKAAHEKLAAIEKMEPE